MAFDRSYHWISSPLAVPSIMIIPGGAGVGSPSAANQALAVELTVSSAGQLQIGGGFVIAGNIDLNGTYDLIFDADADTYMSCDDVDDVVDVYVNGAKDFTISANLLSALSGSVIGTDTISETTSAAGVTIDGLRIKDSAIAPAAGGSAWADLSNCATGEADTIVGANLADAWTLRTASLTFLKLVTTTATPGIVETFTVTATSDAHKITTTVNSATGVVSGFNSSITTATTAHTAGKIAAGTFAVTSLAGDTGGVFACLDLVSTDGGGTTPTHAGIHCASPLDALLYVDATGSGSVVVGAMTAKSPETDAEAGYFSIQVGATRYEVPMYAVT